MSESLRLPAYPLVTHTPYFSIWSMDDAPNRETTRHWTGKPNPLTGTLRVGERAYGFLGRQEDLPPLETVAVEVTATSTRYVLESPQARLEMTFTSPLLLEDLELLSRPVTYLSVTVTGKFGPLPAVSLSLTAGEELVLDHAGQSPVVAGTLSGAGWQGVTLANSVQCPLNCSGDDVRIDWGTFCLAAPGGEPALDDHSVTLTLPVEEGKPALFLLAYDEVKAIRYFGRDLDPLWKKYHPSLAALLDAALADYPQVLERCAAFDAALRRQAVTDGGEHYAQLLEAAYRQAIAAHCLCEDPEDGLLFISKECFSNGCAATADVSYPSIPLFLLFRPELVQAMMKPIFRYAASPVWPFDFAPHDAGQYPLLEGQVYSEGTDPRWQMPVEECGNLLLMTAAAEAYGGDPAFADAHWALLTKWAEYLRSHGMDPENQLCTDDFAGHLAHNCNLSIKAILGMAVYGRLLDRRQPGAGETWAAEARSMAARWLETAANGDGTYRLAFDRPGTFSLKYNAVWDRLLTLGLFPAGCWDKELASYIEKSNPYGVPLDNRAGYTKSDWLVWCASMMGEREAFIRLTDPLWLAYHHTPSRVPLSDWYETQDAHQVSFQNRTVQGGLFIRLLAPLSF